MRGKKKSGKTSSSKRPNDNNKKKEETPDQELVEKSENVDNSKERAENGDTSSKRTTKKIIDEPENVDNLKDKTEDGAGPSKKGSKKTAVAETDSSANSVRGRNKRTTNNSDEPLPSKKLRVRKEPVKTEVESTKAKSREYEVEAILNQRKNKSVEEFLIKWKGYSEKENSWVPKSHLNCKRLLDDFLKSKK